mmetsp:Transcript_26886/g.50332  ORF Transcript_26886/g.50332 Transcript_26886/m.50332 type:complete len:445 (-) Transcript_26886:1580-2914(-)
MTSIQCMENLVTDEIDDHHTGQFESLEELESKTDKCFFKFLSSSYSAFLKGDEKHIEELMMVLADRLERDDAVIVQEIEQMTDRNAAIVEKMNNLSMGEKELEELVQKRESYATDLEQFHDLIQQMDQHVATLNQKKKDGTKELEETNRKLNELTDRVQKLKETVKNQELSLEDVQKMQNERKGVEEATDRAIALRDQRRSTLWEIEAELDKLWNELETLVSDYNSNLGELNLLPLVSSKGIEMKAIIDKDGAQDPNPARLLAVDMQQAVLPALTAFRDEFASLISECKWKYQEALDQLEQSEEAFTEAMEKHRIVEHKIDKCEETMEAEREAQEAKLGVRVREAESIENKVASLRDPVALEEQMAQFERQCAELEAMRQQYEEENLARKKAVCDEIEQACSAMQEYDQFCLKKIAEVHEYRKDKRASYGELRLPRAVEEETSN